MSIILIAFHIVAGVFFHHKKFQKTLDITRKACYTIRELREITLERQKTDYSKLNIAPAAAGGIMKEKKEIKKMKIYEVTSEINGKDDVFTICLTKSFGEALAAYKEETHKQAEIKNAIVNFNEYEVPAIIEWYDCKGDHSIDLRTDKLIDSVIYEYITNEEIEANNLKSWSNEELQQDLTIKTLAELNHIDNIEVIKWKEYGCHKFTSLGAPHPDYYDILATPDTENLSLELDHWNLKNDLYDLSIDLNTYIDECVKFQSDNLEADLDIDYKILDQDEYIEFTHTNTSLEPTEYEPQSTLLIILDCQIWEA